MADLVVLGQLIDSMEEGVMKLEEAKEGNNLSGAGEIKRAILNFQKRINQEIRRGR